MPESIKLSDDHATNEEADEMSMLASMAGSMEESHFDPDVLFDATWGEVFQNCCVHTWEEWLNIAIGTVGLCFFLYFFLFALDMVTQSAKVLGGCAVGGFFGEGLNPVAAVVIGLWTTALIQSSSTTTSIVVSLTGNGLSLSTSIYIIMGANIGTTITNCIVATGQMGDADQLERAFAGATCHSVFNIMTCMILFPLELITGYLEWLTGLMVKNASTRQGEDWDGPIKAIVYPLTMRVIIANKDLINDVATGVKSCADFYPIKCEDGVVSYDTCQTGLISCDESSNRCPAFFDVNATAEDDQVAGGVCLFLAVCILFSCLIGLVLVLQRLLMGVATRIIYKATSVNGYLAIAIGCGVTVLVQSSSITTSVLTPICGLGIIRLEQMYPLTLGANLGTTFKAVMTAMLTEGTQGLQAALAHVFYNLTGVVIWYPIPFMRLPVFGARHLGKATRLWRGFPFLYLFSVFFAIPGILLGISSLFEQGKKGWTTLGAFLSVVLGLVVLSTCCWFRTNGTTHVAACFRKREKRRVTMETLPEDMEFLKAQVMALIDHVGLPDDDLEAESEATENKVQNRSNNSTEIDGAVDGDINVDVNGDVDVDEISELIKKNEYSREIQA